jgi:hypothetical protein
MDLDLGGVQIDRRPRGEKGATLPGRQQPNRPGDQAGHGPLDPGDLCLAEAARQRRGRGRRRRRKAAQPAAHPVGALVVAVDQEVPTGQQRLGQPHQQLAWAKAAARRLIGPTARSTAATTPRARTASATTTNPAAGSDSGRRRAAATAGGAVVSSSPVRCLSLGASVGLSNPDSL